jgi:uncharacterized protein (TIGR02231 family)
MPAQAVEATVDTSGSAVSFRIPGQVDIPADGTAHKVTVLALSLKPEMDFVTAPKGIPEVFRRAQIVNDSQVTLLPGRMSLFYGGEYVGNASLPRIAPHETFETTLGIEDRITVRHELVLKEVGKQLIGDRRVQRYGYEIVAQNLLSEQAKVTIRDLVPVAAHEDVRVRLERVEPAPKEQDEQGRLAWEFELEPEGQAQARFEFTVAAPRGALLVGLPD